MIVIGIRCALVWLAMGVAWNPVSIQLLYAQDDANAEGASQELIDLVIGLLNDDDQEMRAVGLEQIRSELKGEAATQQLLAELPKLNPPAQVGLLRALGERGDVTARPALIEILQDANIDVAVKAAAIGALGALGNETDIPMLLELLASSNAELKSSAIATLVRLPGSATSALLAKSISEVPAETRITLIEIAVARRMVEAIPALLQTALVSNVPVRSAAMKALGEIGRPENLPGMVAGVLNASSGNERDAAEKAVMFVCHRIEDPEQRATLLLAAVEQLSSADQLRMLSTIGRVGGTQALDFVESKIAIPDQQQHKLGVRALCNWPDASVAARLLELHKSERSPDYRAIILNALIRVAPLPDGRSDGDRLQLLQTAMQLCTKDNERKLVLQRASAIRTIETLRYVLTFCDHPALALQVHEAVVELAHHRSLREPNKAEFDAALDKVLAASQDEIVLDRAQRYKNGQTWDRKSVSGE
jgi:hypothetical protein